MKKIFFYFLFLTAFISCRNNANEVLLNYTSLGGVVPKETNFNFTFDEDLAPDSIVGIWQRTKYVEFSPDIKGEFKWISPKELVFSPVQKLSPATKYTAKITKNILKYVDNKKINIDDIDFQTENLSVETVKMYWTKNDKNQDIVKLAIAFSELIDIDDIDNNLILKYKGSKVKRTLDFTGKNTNLIFSLPDIQKSDDDLFYDLTLAKGILPVGGNLGTEEPFFEKVLLQSPYNLQITNVEAEHDGVQGKIKVLCSQKVQAKDVEKFIDLSPNIAYTIQHNEDGFDLLSNKFSLTEKYQFTLKKGMLGNIGGKLKSDFTKDVTFGNLEPEIKFEKDRSFYLSANGYKNVEAKIVNVKKVKVIISKVYENNLLTSRNNNEWFNTSENYYESYYDDYYYDDYYYYNYSDQVVQDIVFEKSYNTSDFEKIGENTLLKLDFTDKLKGYKGIYHIDIRSDDDRWLSDSRFVSISDIGMIVKNGETFMSVFTNSISTTNPLQNINLKVFGKNNQLAGEGTTDSEGYARITLINKDVPGFEPALVTAQINNDYNVLMLRDTKVNMNEFEVGGYRNTPNGLQTFIYPERDMYRPGETVNYACIVRNNQWDSPGNIPLKVEIRTPNGKLLSSYKKTLNNEGSFEAEFATSSSKLTGNYTINVFSSNDVFMGSKNIRIEEFMPDRIKVETTADKKIYQIGEKAKIKILAENLYGTPAANRNYEVDASFSRVRLSPKEFKQFNFEIKNKTENFAKIFKSGKTNNLGLVNEMLDIPNAYANMGKLQAVVYTTVFDETNRPVNTKNVLDISTQKDYFGIGVFDYYVATNKPVKIPLVAIDKTNKLSKGAKAKVQIIKHEYKNVLSKEGDYFKYNSQPYEKVVLEKEMILNSVQYLTYTPDLSGQYEVRIASVDNKKTYVSNVFYSYAWGSTSNSSFEVSNEGKIEMEFDKETYQVGDKAKVLFKTPFDGKILVTVERENVINHFYLQTKNRAAEYIFPTSEDYIPNAYITATLFKEHKQTEFPLTVAHGFKSMSVSSTDRKLKVEIKADKSTRSKSNNTITVKTEPNANLTIAVVDEGILQVSNFKTPNPFNYFYQNRALQVSSYDIYPYLFKEISASNAKAGDDGFDLTKRINPMLNNRVKLVSYWSGMLKADANGNATVNVDIPQFSGSLRVMVVAHKGNAFGNAETKIQVADPLILSSSIPRFFSPGDTAIITTTLNNTTNSVSNAVTAIKCSGPLKVVSNPKLTNSIEAKGETRVEFKVYVQKEIGQAKITITSQALGETFTEETDISIRPASPLLKETGSGFIDAGKKKSFQLANENFIKSSVDYKVIISKNPMVEFAKDLDYLVQYPFGCSEQTVSSVFPQLYYSEIANALYKQDKNTKEINNNINAAITKLKMRQIFNGGILMWDEMSQENWWVTIYTAHFLIEAKKAGYNVDQAFIDKTLEYIKNRLKSKETVNYYYDRGTKKQIAPHEVAYGLYVLSLAGKPDKSLMNYYKSKTDLLTADCQYLLAAAFALSGDKQKAKEILPNAYKPMQSDKQMGQSFYSPIRDEALALNALLDIDPNNSAVGEMAMHVSKNLRNSKYINTQERIFSLLALGKIAKKTNQTKIEAIITSNGKKITTYNDGILTFSTKDIVEGKLDIQVNGMGKLYYFYETEGISKDGSFKQEDNYLKIRKTFFNRNGAQISTNSLKLNDLIVVRLTLSSAYDGTIDNIAISDILPACFEIENPNTDEIPGTEWINNQTSPDYRDIRDDRINLFDNYYGNNAFNYYYVVRVVSRGTYQMGPVAAEAMYNGEYHSYSGGGRIIVR